MLTLIISLTCLVLAIAITEQHEVVFQLRQGCERLYVDVEPHKQVDVKAFKNTAPFSVAANTSCVAFFKTSLPNHGLCVRLHTLMLLSEHVRIEFQTGPFSPDRVFHGKMNGEREFWCFPERLLAVRIITYADQQFAEKAVFFSFSVTNQSLETLPRDYYMDSFAECGQTHTLSSGQEVSLKGERQPRVTPDLPDVCALTFKTSSGDEFEQVCLTLSWVTFNSRQLEGVVEHTDNEEKEKNGVDLKKAFEEANILQIEGLNPVFYTTYQALGYDTVCSDQKQLKLIFNRTKHVTAKFLGSLSSRRHPHWEKEASEAKQLKALRIVKGITYFIATIDSLIAIAVAALAAFLKRPSGPFQRWAESFNALSAAHPPQPYPAPALGERGSSYGSMHACKDGNYPELPAEGATHHTTEVYVESHNF